MFIYNITTKISWTINDAWVRWMKEEHIPAIMKTGCFTEHRFVKLMDTDEAEGPTYAVQFYAASMDEYEKYIADHTPGLRDESMQKWGDQFISFRSLMQFVD